MLSGMGTSASVNTPTPVQVEEFKAQVSLYEASKDALDDAQLLRVMKRSFLKGIKVSELRLLIEENGGDEYFEYLTTKDVCKEFIEPINKQGALSYCDYLLQESPKRAKGSVGVPTVFVSHSWKSYYGNVVRALEKQFKDEPDVSEVRSVCLSPIYL